MTSNDIAALFRRYAPMVHRRALILLGNASDAEDATQEVFIRALKSLDRFEGRCQVATWFYQITTHHCLDVLRARRTYQRMLEGESAKAEVRIPGAPSETDMHVFRALLREADHREAQAAISVYVDGMSHEEAASVLGVSRRTVGNLLERFNRFAQSRLAGELRGEVNRP